MVARILTPMSVILAQMSRMMPLWGMLHDILSLEVHIRRNLSLFHIHFARLMKLERPKSAASVHRADAQLQNTQAGVLEYDYGMSRIVPPLKAKCKFSNTQIVACRKLRS